MKEALSTVLTAWDRLVAAAIALKDIPCVEDCRVQLARELASIRALRARRADLRAEMLQSTRELERLVAQGAGLASRIRAGAKFRYGDRSEKLRKFGIKPIPRRRKLIRKETP